MWWTALTGRLEQAKVLDPVADAVAGAVDTVLPEGPVKDGLHGTFLGHPLHPVLIAAPIGMWSGASLLDLAGERRAARTLVGAGLLAALPTAAAGFADWSSIGAFRKPKRVGLVHGVANLATAGIYLASWLARRRGDHARGASLALAGSAGLVVGGYLGGHLAYSQGVAVNRNADWSAKPKDWADAGAAADVGDGALVRVEVAGQPVLLVRSGGRLAALGAMCSHYGAPLEDGELVDGCVVCPWHASRFRLSDGAVERGPATAPQPAYDVRERDGRVEVRARA